MFKTVEAEIDEVGRIRPTEDVSLTPGTRVLITILGEVSESAMLSQTSLAEDWLRPEEDEAWAHLNEA